ncbi:hypothetical protein [Pedococcus soli]
MAKYDPDRITPENFDAEDAEMVDGYLDHPNTVAMHEELGRQFRARSPEEQIPVIEEVLATDRRLRQELHDVLRQEDPARSDPRWVIVDKLNESISLAEGRLEELRSEIDRS